MAAKDDFLASVATLSTAIDRVAQKATDDAATITQVDQSYTDAKAQVDALTAKLDAIAPADAAAPTA